MVLRRTKNETLSPIVVVRSRSSSSSSIEDSFFLRTYVPLSNLPTPPLGFSNNPTRQQSPEAFSPGEVLDPELLGPAVHLTNLIPSSTSLTPASVPLVQSILARANLPTETVALAVCILDSLNSRFALAFRHGCPLTPPPPSTRASYFPSSTQEVRHIDSIHPELLILSALILAVKYLNDEDSTTTYYASEWGKDIWTCAQLNYTQHSILQNIGYKIAPLWDDEVLSIAMEDMKRAGQQYEPLIYDEDTIMYVKETMVALDVLNPMSSGKAVLGAEDQITPAETPMEGVFSGTKDLSSMTRKAFSTSRAGEPFPMYVEPRTG